MVLFFKKIKESLFPNYTNKEKFLKLESEDTFSKLYNSLYNCYSKFKEKIDHNNKLTLDDYENLYQRNVDLFYKNSMEFYSLNFKLFFEKFIKDKSELNLVENRINFMKDFTNYIHSNYHVIEGRLNEDKINEILIELYSSLKLLFDDFPKENLFEKFSKFDFKSKLDTLIYNLDNFESGSPLENNPKILNILDEKILLTDLTDLKEEYFKFRENHIDFLNLISNSASELGLNSEKMRIQINFQRNKVEKLKKYL